MVESSSTTQDGRRTRSAWTTAFVVFCLAAVGFTVYWLARTAYCAMTWKIFSMFDYGSYTNMIRNAAEGMPLRMLLDDSYLKTHLSFSLALLGPILKVWHHPMALWYVQLGAAAGGAALTWRAGRRSGIRVELLAALVLLFFGYHFSQAALLSEVHGVTFYLFLIPWLYYTIRFHRRLTWLPLLVTLGLREDAFTVVIPVLLYFAIRDRWWMGYVYVALAVAYGLFAIFELYPFINGVSLLKRRGGEIAGNPLAQALSAKGIRARLPGLLWVTLPSLPFFFMRRKGWLPVLTFPAMALLQILGSKFRLQYELAVHYPAPVLACLFPAFVEAASRAFAGSDSPRSRLLPLATAGWLTALTLASHILHGFIPGGGARQAFARYYTLPSPDGIKAIEAAQDIPQEGSLVCDWRLAGICANRRDLIIWRKYDPARHQFDLVFFGLRELGGRHGKRYAAMLEGTDFGVIDFNGDYVLLKRGAGARRNAEILETYRDRQRRVSAWRMNFQDVEGVRNVKGRGNLLRHWEGAGHRGPVTIAFGISAPMREGRHRVAFVLRAARPAKQVKGTWGQLSLHKVNERHPLVEAEIEPIATDNFRTQYVDVVIQRELAIEPRVTGGDAPIWIESVEFEEGALVATPRELAQDQEDLL